MKVRSRLEMCLWRVVCSLGQVTSQHAGDVHVKEGDGVKGFRVVHEHVDPFDGGEDLLAAHESLAGRFFFVVHGGE